MQDGLPYLQSTPCQVHLHSLQLRLRVTPLTLYLLQVAGIGLQGVERAHSILVTTNASSVRVLEGRGTQPTSGKTRSTGRLHRPCCLCLLLLGGDSSSVFPVLAKMGATGQLAPPRECQVKLARLMDLHFLACLPQASMPSAFTHKAHPGREA